MFLWIKEKITLHYKNLLTKDTIENLQSQLDEQININENMKNEIEKLSKINHKFSSRIPALELYVAKLSNKLANDENISDNILESKKLINRLSTEFLDELSILGYEIKRGKNIAVRTTGMERFARLSTIDKDFSEQNLYMYFKNQNNLKLLAIKQAKMNLIVEYLIMH